MTCQIPALDYVCHQTVCWLTETTASICTFDTMTAFFHPRISLNTFHLCTAATLAFTSNYKHIHRINARTRVWVDRLCYNSCGVGFWSRKKPLNIDKNTSHDSLAITSSIDVFFSLMPILVARLKVFELLLKYFTWYSIQFRCNWVLFHNAPLSRHHTFCIHPPPPSLRSNYNV